MRTWKNKLLLGALLCGLCSCTSHQNPYRIDLTEVPGCRKIATAGELFSSVTYIPLEVTPECLIGAGSLLAVDGNDILVWANGSNVYRFDRSGKFLNTIGRVGNGPGEHGMLNSANYDRREKVLYLGTPGNIIYKYALDGTFLGDFKVPVAIGVLQTVRFNEQLGLVCEIREYTPEGLKVSLAVVSKDGELQSLHSVYEDYRQVEVSLLGTGMLRNCAEGVLFMLPFDDRLFLLNESGLSDSLTLYRGKYSPDREMVEDARRSGELYAEKYTFPNLVVTDKHLYVSIDNRYNQYDVLVDRATGKVSRTWRYQNYDETHHIPLDGFAHVTFWPWISVDSACVADLLPIDRFDEADFRTLEKVASNQYLIGEDSNPVVILAKEM